MRHTTKAVLLDVDGTLIDSNDAHAQSWIEVFAELGHQVAYERVRELIGMGGDKLLPETIGVAKDSPEGREATKRRLAIFKKTYLPRLRAFPGARELLAALKREGFKLVVATSANEHEAEALLAIEDLGSLVDAKTTSSDADSSKPDPDIIVAALGLADCSPSEAVMLGDTPYDVAASVRAGVGVIALRCGGWDDEALARADAIYDDPRDLLARLPSLLRAAPLTASLGAR